MSPHRRRQDRLPEAAHPHHPPQSTPRTADASGATATVQLRRLHHVQVAVLVVIGVVLALAALGFFSSITKAEHERSVLGNAVFTLTRSLGELQGQQVRLQELEHNPGRAMEMLRESAAVGAVLRQQRDATEPYVSDGTRRAADDTVAVFDRLINGGLAWIAESPETRATPLAAFAPLGDDLSTTSRSWIDRLQAQRVATNIEVQRTIDRSQRLLVGMIAGFAIVGLLLWLRVGRQRERLVDGIRRTSQEQAAMREIVTAATWAPSDSVAHVAATQIADLLGTDHVVVLIALNDGATQQVVLPETSVPARVSATREAAAARAAALLEPCLMSDDAGGITAACVTGDGNAAACTSLSVVWSDGHTPPPGALDTLTRVVSTLELALQSAMARERLAAQSITDSLTGLPNHRRFQEQLADEVVIAGNARRPLSLVVLDVDAFSNVNDAYGHEAGDRVLAELALRLRRLSREGDTLARIGGEEFAWLMPGVNAAAAEAAAERARSAVRAEALGMATQLTVSAGIADLSHAHDPKELLRFADLALRQAKSTGHDAVASYDPTMVTEASRGDRFGRLQSLSALRALARAVDMRDENTQRHSERVAALTHRLALEVGWLPQRANRLREAALVHDVGKVGVPDAILLKPGPLTDEERLVIETHPSLGARIVSEILDEEQVAWVRGHHERVDSRGYPDGLRGDDLSPGARIMAVADTWDAMTSDRPYRKALSSDRALEIAVEVAGSQLDPDVVAALVRLRRSDAPETRGHDHASGLHYGTPGAPETDDSPRAGAAET